LLQGIGGGDSLQSIEDVFRRISETVPRFAGLTLSKIGDLGVHILRIKELSPMHPADERAIQQAIAIQAKRRAVQEQLYHTRVHVGGPSNKSTEPKPLPRP